MKRGDKMDFSYEPQMKITDIHLLLHYRNNSDCIHWHENIEILYFLNGECSIINGTEEFKVNKGDIFVVNSEDIHGVIFDKMRCEYIVIHLDNIFCESMGFNTNDVYFVKKIHNKEIESLILNAHKENQQKKEYYKESIKLSILSVLLILFRDYVIKDTKEYKTSNKVKLTKKIIKYIKKHFNKALTIEEIENHCRYSRFYISRVFKEITGVTIMSYLNQVRTQKAKSLLQNSNLNISEVASQCGFISQSYFGKIFKKYENMSPIEYKKKVQK